MSVMLLGRHFVSKLDLRYSKQEQERCNTMALDAFYAFVQEGSCTRVTWKASSSFKRKSQGFAYSNSPLLPLLRNIKEHSTDACTTALSDYSTYANCKVCMVPLTSIFGEIPATVSAHHFLCLSKKCYRPEFL